MSFARHERLRPIAVAFVGTLLLALSACGGSSDDESSGAPPAGGEEQQVRTAVAAYYDALGDYDAATACRLMTPKAQRQFATGGLGDKSGKDRVTCADAFGEFLDQAKENGGLERTLSVKVGKVAIDGNEAVVTVRFGPQTGKLPMTKVGGEWRMGISVASP